MTTTPVPTCTDDLLAEIDVPRYDCTSGGVTFCQGCYTMEECEYGDYVSVDDYAALLARLHAAEKDAGRWRHARTILDIQTIIDCDKGMKNAVRIGFHVEEKECIRADETIDAAMEARK